MTKTKVDITDLVFDPSDHKRWNWEGIGLEFSFWSSVASHYLDYFDTAYCIDPSLGDKTLLFTIKRECHNAIAAYDPTYELMIRWDPTTKEGEAYIMVEEAVATIVKLSL